MHVSVLAFLLPYLSILCKSFVLVVCVFNVFNDISPVFTVGFYIGMKLLLLSSRF